MNRILKFRIFSFDLNMFLYFDFSTISFLAEREDSGNCGMRLYRSNISGYGKLGKFVNLLEKDMETIQQFTGLKDKNGKEIYEGDIVKSSVIINRIQKGIFLIRWNSFLCNFALDWMGRDEFQLKNGAKSNGINKKYNDWDTDFAKLTGAKSDKLEIIGNIFENPKLLT